MEASVRFLNDAGAAWEARVLEITWQTGLLVLLLLVLNRLLARRVRAGVRYALWCLLPVKLLLPVGLALPTSPGWWLGEAPSRPVDPAGRAVGRGPGTGGPWVTYQRANDAAMPGERGVRPEPGVRLNHRGGLLLVWLAGWIGLGGLLVARSRRLAGVLVRAEAPSPELVARLERLARELGMPRTPRLVMTAEVGGPAVCGVRQPTILLPPELVSTLGPARVDHVLLHELMHVKRGDLWWSHLQSLLLVVNWLNPVLWLADARIRRVREEATDEAVAVARRSEVLEYAETLLAVARQAGGRSAAWLGLVGILDPGSALAARVRRLVTLPVPARSRLGWLAWVGVLAFGSVVIPLARGKAAATTETPVATAPVERVADSGTARSGPPGGVGASPVPTASSATPGLQPAGSGASAATPPGLEARGHAASAEGSSGLGAVRPGGVYSFHIPADLPLDEEGYARWLSGLRTAIAAVKPWSGEETVLLDVDARTAHRAVAAAVGAARSAGFRRVRIAGSGADVEVPRFQPGASGGATDSAAPSEPRQLHTRTFHLASRQLETWLTAIGHPVAEEGGIGARLLQFLVAAGFPRVAPNAVFFNERNGLLMVRGTEADIAVIEDALDVLSAQTPAQYVIEAEFARVPPGLELPAGRSLFRDDHESAELLGPSALAASRKVLADSGASVEVLSAPKVVTLDGRQAQVHALRPGEPSFFGTTLDVLPVRLASGHRVSVSLVASHWRPDPAAGPIPSGGLPGAALGNASRWATYELTPGECLRLRVSPQRLRTDAAGLTAPEPARGPEALDLVALVTVSQIDPAGNVVR